MSDFYNGGPAGRAYFVALDEAGQVVGGAGVAEYGGIEGGAELHAGERVLTLGAGESALIEDAPESLTVSAAEGAKLLLAQIF